MHDAVGNPLRSGNVDLCNPCSHEIGGKGARKVSMVLDDAIVAKGPFPSAVMLGYATVVVRGDSNAVALSAFLANSHTSAFDMSMTVLPLTEISLRP